MKGFCEFLVGLFVVVLVVMFIASAGDDYCKDHRNGPGCVDGRSISDKADQTLKDRHEADDKAMQQAIVDAMTNAPQVRRLIHLRTEHLGPDDVLVGAKLEFDPDLTVPALAKAIDDVEARVRSVVPAARVMYLEPDVHRGD